MIEHLDIITDGAKLNEASFSRIFQHISNGNGIMIASAYRSNNPDGSVVPDAVNVRNTRRLASMVRAEGLGFFYLDGRWEDEETGIVHPEVSVMIPGDGDPDRMKRLGVKLAKTFNQDAVLLVPPGTENAILLDKTGKTVKLGKFRPDQKGAAKIWSEVKFGSKHRSRPFTFESAKWHRPYNKPDNMMEAWNRVAKEREAAAA